MKHKLIVILLLPLMMLSGCEEKGGEITNGNISLSCAVKDKNGQEASMFETGEPITVEYTISNLADDTLYFNPFVSSIAYHPEWLSIHTSAGSIAGYPCAIVTGDAPMCAKIPPKSDISVSFTYPDEYENETGKATQLPAGEYEVKFTPAFVFYDGDCSTTSRRLKTDTINIKFSVL